MAEFILESKCAEIFAKAPYKFKPRANKALDYEIARQIKIQDIRVPIIQI
jgi:hypothetical protein